MFDSLWASSSAYRHWVEHFDKLYQILNNPQNRLGTTSSMVIVTGFVHNVRHLLNCLSDHRVISRARYFVIGRNVSFICHWKWTFGIPKLWNAKTNVQSCVVFRTLVWSYHHKRHIEGRYFEKKSKRSTGAGHHRAESAQTGQKPHRKATTSVSTCPHPTLTSAGQATERMVSLNPMQGILLGHLHHTLTQSHVTNCCFFLLWHAFWERRKLIVMHCIDGCRVRIEH